MGALTTARHAALLAALETCWLYALVVLLVAMGGGEAPVAAAVFLSIFANLWFNLLPELEGGSKTLLAGRIGAALLAVALLGLLPPRPELVALALYLAWHARALAELDLPESRYRDSVFAGALALAVVLLARALAPPPTGPAVAQARAVISFALLAPLALILAQRLQLMEEEDLAPSGVKSWAIGGGALAAGGAATGLLVLLVPGTAQAALAALRLLGTALSTALYYLLLPLAWLAFALLYRPLLWLIQHAHLERLPRPQTPSQDPTAQLRQQQAALNATLSHWLHAAQWLLLTLAVLVVLLIVSAGIRRRADPARRSSDRRGSVWRWSLLGDWLGGLLNRAVRAAPALAHLPLLGKAAAQPRSARDLYVDVQRRTAALGWGRSPQQTALEHCARLAERLPAVAPALEQLAMGYGEERYGGASPARTLPALLPSWRQIVDACEAMQRDGP